MQITVQILDDIAQKLNKIGDNLSRELLAIIIADAYRWGKINTAEERQILQLPSHRETHACLKRMGVYLNYDKEELECEVKGSPK